MLKRTEKYRIKKDFMEKILISACLIGDKTKYDGSSNKDKNPYMEQLLEKYELVPFCPEVAGGLKTPRNPSERKNDRVIMNDGTDVTRNFRVGADKALDVCLYLGIKVAILKERSPSCGVHQIHNGRFENKLIAGQGVTAELLKRKGIRVISEEEIEDFLNEDK